MPSERYFLYMDESGAFEGGKKKVAQPALTAVLVPEATHDILGDEIQNLWKAHRIIDRHAMSTSNPRQPAYLAALLSLLHSHQCLPFILRHLEDVRKELPDDLSEAFAANRYLDMANTLFEYILFLHPPFLGKDMELSLRPNSRVTVLDKKEKSKINNMKNMGFGSSAKDDCVIFYSWTNDVLRTKVHQCALEYAPWIPSTGKRTFFNIETIIAKDSNNPLVHVMDHLAYLSRADIRGEKNLLAALSTLHNMSVCLNYDRKQRVYRELARQYLAGEFDTFFPEALRFFAESTDRLHRHNLEAMLNKAATRITLTDIKYLDRLEQLAGSYLRVSDGNWQFVLDLVDRLIDAVDNWPEQQKKDSKCQWLLYRLHGHKQSIFNHRGQDVNAWDTYEAMERLDLGKCTVDEYREKIAVENRAAVTLANVFAFQEGIDMLEPFLATLQDSQDIYEQLAGAPLYDALLGKLRGTKAQNFAFLATRQTELFAETENFFLEAAQEFTKESDKIRHDINLLHLYLDWCRVDTACGAKATEIVATLKNYRSVAAFLAAPSPGTAKYQQFALTILLKHALLTTRDWSDWPRRYPLAALKEWFGNVTNEHPFEFACAYLGRMAFAVGRRDEAEEYLEHALSIPPSEDPGDHPTLQAIKAEILVWWAMEEQKAGERTKATEKMLQAKKLMEEIGKSEGLETILNIDENGAATGWFAEGWQALSGVDWQATFDQAASDTFLGCFTFNYR